MKRFKQFWSSYSRLIVRFWTYQLPMSFLGLSVGLATIALDHPVISWVGSLFCIAMLCFLQYDNLFQVGEKDHYRPADITRPKKTLGLKVSLLASVPLFLLILTGMLVQYALKSDSAAVFKLIYHALNGSYVQLHAFAMECSRIAKLDWILFLLYTVPSILFASLGYVLGASDKPLRTFFGIRVSGTKNQKK